VVAEEGVGNGLILSGGEGRLQYRDQVRMAVRNVLAPNSNVVTIHTAHFKIKIICVCPLSVFVCFVAFLQHTVIIYVTALSDTLL